MATYAYREQALIELVAETSTARRELSSVSKVGKQFQLDQMKASLEAQSHIDKASRKTFKNLEDDLKSANRTAAEGRKAALASFQDTAVTKPPAGLEGDMFDMPNVAAEHRAQLKAMEGNMNEFRSRMANMDIDVGTGATMEEDMETTMGGDADVRKKGLATMKQMQNLQQATIRDIKTEIELSKQRLVEQGKELKKEEKQLSNKKRGIEHTKKLIQDQEKITKAVDKRTKAGKKEVIILKSLKEDLRIQEVTQKNINKNIKTREKALEKEARKLGDLGDELDDVKRANNDLNRTYQTGLNLNQSLAAVEGKRTKVEMEAVRKANKENGELNRKKRKQIELDRQRQVLAKEFNAQVDAMATSFKTTLVTAIAASTAATTAFFNKLNEVNSTFMAFEEELMNAQSIFQASNDTLFGLSDQIVDFGNKYGVSMENASAGLYTLASAGLDAEQSMEVLGNTLKLSMAVQGDHETIAKLTTQTIFGFGMEMSDSAELTDKFAHSINKSLIEYDDLASAVKFSMPFFVSTGQSIDQLLGSLEILTNRALEAGIAGRGLRQALAEFAQHAEDNTAAFRKMGVEIMNTDGSFKLLTEIAREFSDAMGPAASDVDLMTTLLQDLNVRGATAFVHLVQNVDEFEGAVGDLANSAGSATRMADIQQKSLANQIQVVKNALVAPFLLSDKVGRANGTMNQFGQSLHDIVTDFESFFIVTLPDGTKNLTDMGSNLRDTVIIVLEELSSMIKGLLGMFASLNKDGNNLAGMFSALMIPLNLLVKAITILGSDGVKTIIMFKALNALLPITELHTIGNVLATAMLNTENSKQVAIKGMLLSAQIALNIGLVAGLFLLNQQSEAMQALGKAVLFAAGAYAAFSIAQMAGMKGGSLIAATVGGGVLVGAMGAAMSKVMQPPDMPTFDMGGRIMYDTGGSLGSRHFPVLVEPGETIIPKTQNMLSGGGGITLNIQGDIVTNDADDFAERIAQVLPEALRRQNDMGGI